MTQENNCSAWWKQYKIILPIGILAGLCFISIGLILALNTPESVPVDDVPFYIDDSLLPPIVIVAAQDSSAASKASATYFCDGEADENEIQQGIDKLGNKGGTVLLTEGTYSIQADIRMKIRSHLRGQGENVTILSFVRSSHLTTADIAPNVRLSDFTITGKGGIFLTNSNILVKNVTAYRLDNSKIGSFVVYPANEVLENVTFYNCKAIDCDRWGFVNVGEGTPSKLKNSRWIRCQAINSGRYNHFVGYEGDPGWDVGFDITENVDVENLVYQDCYASGSWESGFHMEPLSQKKNIRLINCTSEDNGQKTNLGVRNPEYGSGYILYSDVNVENCTSINNKIGFNFRYGYGRFVNCKDVGSDVGFRFYSITKGLELRSCSAFNETKPVYFYLDEMRNVILDDLTISSPVNRSTPAILVESQVRNAGEILIQNSRIQGYQPGILNEAYENVKINNVRMLSEGILCDKCDVL